MTRNEINKEIEQTFGFVPGFFAEIPDRLLETEWTNMRQVQLEEGPIPPKYRELIGLSQAAATHCRYCTLFHTEFARLNGATEDEIQDTLHLAKSYAGWSTLLNGSQYDYDKFRKEVARVGEHIRKNR